MTKQLRIFGEKIYRAMLKDITYNTILIGDFNGKLGHKKDNTEAAMNSFGYRERNGRYSTLLNFLLRYKLYAINSCFKKNKQSK